MHVPISRVHRDVQLGIVKGCFVKSKVARLRSEVLVKVTAKTPTEGR